MAKLNYKKRHFRRLTHYLPCVAIAAVIAYRISNWVGVNKREADHIWLCYSETQYFPFICRVLSYYQMTLYIYSVVLRWKWHVIWNVKKKSRVTEMMNIFLFVCFSKGCHICFHWLEVSILVCWLWSLWPKQILGREGLFHFACSNSPMREAKELGSRGWSKEQEEYCLLDCSVTCLTEFRYLT